VAWIFSGPCSSQDALVSLDPLRTVGREIADPILAHELLPKSGAPR
jgi:peptide/nickel transport system ATP-binding protein